MAKNSNRKYEAKLSGRAKGFKQKPSVERYYAQIFSDGTTHCSTGQELFLIM